MMDHHSILLKALALLLLCSPTSVYSTGALLTPDSDHVLPSAQNPPVAPSCSEILTRRPTPPAPVRSKYMEAFGGGPSGRVE